jgi:hypothetical protein
MLFEEPTNQLKKQIGVENMLCEGINTAETLCEEE